MNKFGDGKDSLDAVVDKEALAASLQLELDRGTRDGFRELHDVSLNCQAVARRRFDDAHVAQAGKRHVQRARDRSGRHRDHVDFLSHLFDAFLVRDSEALLFIHDKQP